jgi:mRNA interferase MazF
MPRLQQGSVVWADLASPAGRRPVVVLTRDAAIGKLNALTVGPITRTIRNIPSEVLLTPADGVPTSCAVALDNILTVSRSLLDSGITTLPRPKMHQVFTAIRYVFDMP